MKTAGNTVFISGGSAGIGLAIAKKLAASGNKIIINGRDPERLQNALSTLPNDTIGIQGDLSIEAERIRVSALLLAEHPELNIIINNAGAAYLNDLGVAENNVAEKASQEMNTNYISVVHFTHLLLPHLLKQAEAAVVNVTSIAAFRGNRYLPTYAASKAAVHSYTEGLRDTFADQTQIGIYELCPPLVNTDFSAEIGGAQGIPPTEVADELLSALAINQYEVPVGDAKKYMPVEQPVSSK